MSFALVFLSIRKRTKQHFTSVIYNSNNNNDTNRRKKEMQLKIGFAGDVQRKRNFQSKQFISLKSVSEKGNILIQN